MSTTEISFKTRGVDPNGEILLGSEQVKAVVQSLVRAFEASLDEKETRIAELESNTTELFQKYVDESLSRMRLTSHILELESALRWSRDNNTGQEPSLSVMQRYYDELIPKEQGE